MTDRLRIVRADQIPTDILTTLRQEGNEGWGVHQYPDRLATRFRRSRMVEGITQLGIIVEPVDRALGMDPAKPVAKAFRAGGLIGLRVAAACVDNIDTAFGNIALMPSMEGMDDNDKLHTRQLFANEIVNIGDESYACVDEIFDPLFDEWEQQLVPDVRQQRYLRSGFGVPMAYLFALHAENEHAARSADLAAMEAELAKAETGSINWDALLA